jgi:hypothetical protein
LLDDATTTIEEFKKLPTANKRKVLLYQRKYDKDCL